MKIDVNELLEKIREGVNPFEYVENDSDVDLLSSAIVQQGEEGDPFYNDTAEMLLKAIIYYLKTNGNEEKSLKRCKEIAELGTDRSKMDELFANVDSSNPGKMYYSNVSIASDRTYSGVIEVLNKKLSSIVK